MADDAPPEISGEEAAQRMRDLTDGERLRLITWGVLEGKVVDGRSRFQQVRTYDPWASDDCA